MTARDNVTIVVGNSYGNPSIAEQVHLEAINLARENPTVEAARLNLDLNEGPPSEIIVPNSTQPLVFNHYLHIAAQQHTQDMVVNKYQEHLGLDGRYSEDRAVDAGYYGTIVGENLSSSVQSIPIEDEYGMSLQLHDDLFIDAGVEGRGHRINILRELYKEVGIGFLLESNWSDYAYGGVVTCNFGSYPEGPNFLLGVVYDDSDNSGTYSAGEGIGQVEIRVNGSEQLTLTADAGGYGLPLESGSYLVHATLADGRKASKPLFMEGRNKKIDFTLADFASESDPIVSLSAERETIHMGQSTRLIWATSLASTVSLNNEIGMVPLSGAVEVAPFADTTYTITATSSFGTITKDIHITVLGPLPAVNFTASPQTIWHGNNVVLSWDTEHALSCSLDQGIGEVDLQGFQTVTPESTTTYTLTAENAEGITKSEVTIIVNRPEILPDSEFQAIELGGSAHLQWTSTNAEECSMDQGIGAIDLNGSILLTPSTTTTYTITCESHGTTSSVAHTVFVNDFSQLPVAVLTADTTVIQPGQPVTLNWQSENGHSFYLDNDIGEIAYSDSRTVTPVTTTTYTFTVIGPAGIARSSVTINVNSTPTPQPDGSFGKFYEYLVPEDATITSYDARRFALVKGTVQDIHGQPLAGVLVTILDNPQYGTVSTNDQGEFALVVEGGSFKTVVYTKAGLLSSQRQVYVPWNDIAMVRPIQMIVEDTKSTIVHFDGNHDTVITHRSSEVSDQFGSRAMTMVFRGDNQAYLVNENGATILELPTIITRATEYSTPQSMPAELPKNSAFTYCAELTVDGIDRVRFAKPVVTYIENFLGFEVGQAVPLGYYDRDKGIWIAEPNGLVVRLLDGDSDGVVDGLDSNGDGSPNDLDGDNDFEDEVMGLTDTDIYSPGTTFWRAEVTHFTPWDYNWAIRELDILFNNGAASADGQLCPSGECKETGSSVSSESQIFHEEIAIPGTGLSLVYASDRAQGFKNVLTVPVSGGTVGSEIKRIIVQVDVAGQILEQTVAAEPNQVVELVWDGLDGFGNKVFHKVTAHVKIGYVYDSVYLESSLIAMSFAEFGTAITSVPGRDEVINWQRSDLTINLADKEIDLAQGWSISAHHKLNPTDPTTLHKGNGTLSTNITSVITTVAGNGEEGWAQNGTDALDTPLNKPVSVALNAAGELYIANQGKPSILKVDRDGIVEIIAGGGQSEDDDIPATSARLRIPSDISFDSRGNLYIADSGACKIRKIDKEGIITTVAGNGNCESSGDNGSALQAGIIPNSIAVDDFGNIYLVEASTCIGGEVDPVTGICSGGTQTEGSFRVRKVSTNGLIATIVGTGEQYNSDEHSSNGDAGPAILAYLLNPTSISIDQDGNLYITDNATIRKVNTSGIITTVAGTGVFDYQGDGGLAIDAHLTLVSGITFDKGGNYYFSQSYGNGNVVRQVTSNGYISTVAGEGPHGYSGDFGAATHGKLERPGRLAIDPAGFLYIPDRGNKLIRKVSLDSYNEEDIYFAESNGIGHLISAAGLHQNTYDLETGVSLLDFDYDSGNNLVSIIDQFGNEVTIERSGSGTPGAIISPDGLRTELIIDNHKQLTQLIYPDSTSHIFEYENNDGLLTAKNEPNDNRFEHFFDSNGRVEKTNDQEGGIWEFSRSKSYEGIVTSNVETPNTIDHVERLTGSTGEEEKTVTTAAGEIIFSATSSDGLDTVTESSCGPKVEIYSDLDRKYGYTYLKASSATTPAGLTLQTSVFKDYVDVDLDGLPETVTNLITVNGKTTTVVHDVQSATNTITSPENRTVTSTYDPNTLLPLRSSIPGMNVTEYNYYSDGKLKTVTTGERIIRYTYDSQGNLATVTDPQSRITRFAEHDEVGRVTSVERADGTIMRYSYDTNGNMNMLTTPTPADNSFTYNGVNKRSTFLTPLGSTTHYSYNEEGQLTTITLSSNKEIKNSYTNGILMETVTPEWINIYGYKCGNLLGSITRGDENISYDYDGTLLTSISQTGTLNESLGYVYNNDLNLTSFVYAGATDNYGYDNDGLLTSAGEFTISRKSKNGLPEMVSTGNFQLDRSFSSYGEVDAIGITLSGSELFGYDLTRNKSGIITTKIEKIEGVENRFDYDYDDFGRLLTVTRDNNLVEEYRYDDNGNRIYEINTQLGIAARSLTYSTEDHIISAGTITYEFDYDDNLASRTDGADITQYSYSSTGELLTVTLADATVISYVNNPLGRRIAKKVNGIIVEKYLWSGMTTLLAVFDGNDALLQRFEYADDKVPYTMMMGGRTYYLNYDQVGSLRLVVDSSGNIVKQVDYDTFGNIISDSNMAFAVPFGFAGGLHDLDTGLVHFGCRDYMPEVGRWTSKDPILFAGGDKNLYGYVGGDPVNFIDPDGLDKHHLIPGEVFRGVNLQPSVKKHLEGITVEAGKHYNEHPHPEYNKYVQGKWDKWFGGRPPRGICKGDIEAFKGYLKNDDHFRKLLTQIIKNGGAKLPGWLTRPASRTIIIRRAGKELVRKTIKSGTKAAATSVIASPVVGAISVISDALSAGEAW